MDGFEAQKYDMGKMMVFADPNPNARARCAVIAVYTAGDGRRFVGQGREPEAAIEIAVKERMEAR